MQNTGNSKATIDIPPGIRSLPRKKILSVLRQIAKSDTPGNGWFQRRKSAAKEIDKLSDGDLVLTSNYYRTDEQRHWLTHRKCGNRFRLSLHELRTEEPQHVCPYCNRPEMDRFGTIDDVSKHVLNISNGRAFFIKNQQLASPEAWYAFYCMDCYEAYDCDFISFRNNADSHRGCPKCRANKT